MNKTKLVIFIVALCTITFPVFFNTFNSNPLQAFSQLFLALSIAPSLWSPQRTRMNFSIEDNLKNIRVTSYLIQDAKKPYWINVNYIVQHSGQKKQHQKKFSKQQKCRNGLMDFCSWINDKEKRDCVEFEMNPTSSTRTNPQSSNEPEFEHREPLLKKRRVDETETTNEQIAPLQTQLTNKFKKKSELGALLLDMRDIVGRLEFSIKTGNFAGVSVGSSIIMESDNKLGYVSDLSPNQQARMTIQANALRCYYLQVIKYVEQIPQQAQRRCESYNFIKLYAGFTSLTFFLFCLFVFATSSPLHRKIGLGNSKRNAIRVAAASVVGLSERSMYRLLENFQNNGYLLSESKIGKHERKWINNNEVRSTPRKS